MSKLYFHYSAMNAGKSAILLQAAHNYRERGMQVMLWTSVHHAADPADERGEIESRIGLRAPAHIYRPETGMFAAIAARQAAGPLGAVFLDEAQFLTAAQVRELARAVDVLGLPVLCYGLRTDFRGDLFAGSAELLALADHLREIRTVCHCGRKATMNLRRQPDGRAIAEGAQVAVEKSDYFSLCRMHFFEALAG
ncbi:thymidine kinase [Maricaulis sp.]|uniref:thymidine kinase n=1 Tax=Maricaulis sp. TaxID=1486257 RepID=UPI0025C1508E|nr:thymidine kinase [Maricaulis sp.]